MAEARTITDPFSGENVLISQKLTDRLRGRYAIGPTLPNGEPEFGWRQFETPPIQHEAADALDKLRATLADIVASIEDYERVNNLAPNPPRLSCWDCVATAKELL